MGPNPYGPNGPYPPGYTHPMHGPQPQGQQAPQPLLTGQMAAQRPIGAITQAEMMQQQQQAQQTATRETAGTMIRRLADELRRRALALDSLAGLAERLQPGSPEEEALFAVMVRNRIALG